MFRNYDPDKYDPNPSLALPPEGRHVLRVEDAEWATSRNGNDMIKAAFSVDGYPGRVFHYFVDNEYLQDKLNSFFSSFGIDHRQVRPEVWRGSRGGAVIRHEEYNGGKQAKVWYFVTDKARPVQPDTRGQDAPADAYEDAGDFPLDMQDFGDGQVETPF
jgi:hypothetical protein